jgi:4-hydroxybenzoyl-CoA thioesterase
MLVNRRKLRIEWGDCDPAGIVYFPRYFQHFDNATVALFEKATGLKKIAMSGKFNFAGIPMVNIRSRFLIPSRYGDDVEIESQVTEFRRSSFEVQHQLFRGKDLAVECFETRVWTAPDKESPGGLKSAAVPDAIKAAFSGKAAKPPARTAKKKS